jgi:fatty-acyl-CoA synthase
MNAHMTHQFYKNNSSTEGVLLPHQWLERWSKEQPEKPALIFGNESFSYQRLWNRIFVLAHGLHLQGVHKGERVVLMSMNHPSFLETYFACSLIGAIFVPINFRLAVPEALFQIEDANPSVVIFGHSQREIAEALHRRLTLTKRKIFLVNQETSWSRDFNELLLDASSSLYEPSFSSLDPGDPQIILYTSGTTGVPKGALLPYRKTYYNSLNAEIFFELTSKDSVLVPVPLFHSLGLNILSVPVLFCGGTVVLLEKFDEKTVLESMEKYKITFMGAIPTIYKWLIDFGLEGYNFPSLRFCFTAGAPISVSLIGEYHRRGILVKQGFGQTETSILCCLDASDAIRKAGSVGKPVHYAEVRVVDEHLQDAQPGQVGEIVARGPIIMLEYWGRPEETARVLADGWLHTQDLAIRDEEGFITLVGRKSDMYISGGENIYPEEIERVYQQHPHIAEVAVFGIPDSDLGETGLACIVPRPGAELNEQELTEYGRSSIAGYKIPRQFEFLEDLPKTETGKIKKYLLRETLCARRQ